MTLLQRMLNPSDDLLLKRVKSRESTLYLESFFHIFDALKQPPINVCRLRHRTNY